MHMHYIVDQIFTVETEKMGSDLENILLAPF